MKKNKSVKIEFSKGELVHIRRFLNRGMDCAAGKCPPYKLVWPRYFLIGVMKKIKLALAEIEKGES
jgi:hypothetical protein